MIESNGRISFGEADETWGKYDLNQMQIQFNDSDTGYKAIIHQGEMVSIVRRGYELLPNEEAVSIADQAAGLAGLVPFDEFTQPLVYFFTDHRAFVYKTGVNLQQGRSRQDLFISIIAIKNSSDADDNNFAAC